MLTEYYNTEKTFEKVRTQEMKNEIEILQLINSKDKMNKFPKIKKALKYGYYMQDVGISLAELPKLE